jgi:hypothetical protein
MWRFEQIWDSRNRKLMLAISAAVVIGIALVDWWTKPYVSGRWCCWERVARC